jgi:hypothetical protein
MRKTEYLKTIEKHVRLFEVGDKLIFDKLLRYYQGKFYTAETGQSESDLLTTSVNLVFAIVETALSSLIPPNPAITAIARSPANEDAVRAGEAFVNLALDTSKYRKEMNLFVFDGVLYGRGIVKTTWSEKKDLPVVRTCDVRSVFFDLTARRVEDIRYWGEATLLSEDEYRKRFESGMYSGEENRLAQPDVYPKWMLPITNSTVNRDELKSYQRWYLVYEIYDLESDRVVHLLAGHEEPLMEDKLLYCPYDLLVLNNNGEDCRGLSEIALISPNQEEVNNLLTFWLNIVRSSVPKGVFDPGGVDSEQMQNAIQAGLGTWSPLASRNGKSLGENLGNFPMPNVPADAFNLLEYTVNNISKVSALADAQRGQVTGARTATELALIEGSIRNRLASRQRRIDEVTASVADKMLFLMQKFKAKDAIVELTGHEGWHTIAPDTVTGIELAFKVVPYSPLESNRAVVQEQFKELYGALSQNPNVDLRALTKVLIEVYDNPALRKHDILLPEPPPAPPGMPGLPAGMPPGAPTPAPPEAMAAAAEQVPASAAAMTPTMQSIADAQAGSAAMNSPVIAPPGPPVGGPV